MTRIHEIDTFMASLDLPEVYRVGGSVRDGLLGRRQKDADYVVRGASLDALEAAIVRAGAKPSPLKLRDGRVVGQRANKRGLGLVEIALPRTEESTGPGHRDFEIITSPDLPLERDAERRDFTINALYLDLKSREVFDPLKSGRDDLHHRILRTTHESSFRDDPLRALRGLRFLSVLPKLFILAAETRDEMVQHAPAVTGLTNKDVSGTVFEEFSKLLMGDMPDYALREGRDTGILHYVMPELIPMMGFGQRSRYHDMTTDEHTFAALHAAAGMHLSLRVRWALLFHDAGKPEAAWLGRDGLQHYYQPSDEQWYEACLADGKVHQGGGELPPKPEDHEVIGARIAHEALTRLTGVPRGLRRDVETLIERHMVPTWGKVKPSKVRRWRAELGDDLLADLLKHRLADCMGKGTVEYPQLQAIERLERIREEAQRAGVPTSTKDLAVTGGEIKNLGVQGAEIGRIQRQLLHEVVSQPDRNDHDWLLERAAKLARGRH